MTTLNAIGTPTITLGGTLTTSGANPVTFTTTGATNVTLPTSGTLVDTGVTTLSSLASIGTITSGTWNGAVIGGTYGGTGVNNGSNTITLAGPLTTSGAFGITFTSTGATNVTLPTSGTLCTTAGSSSITTVGTVTSGIWNANIILGTYGGTGVNNGSSTITIGGNVTFSGAHTFTGTITADTSVTFPTSGTLVNTAVTSLSSLDTVGSVTSGTWSSSIGGYTETSTSANSGTAYTINLSTAVRNWILTLTGNCTLTISNTPGSGVTSFNLTVIQGAGPYTITWPASVIWPGGTIPTLTTTNAHVDEFVFRTTDTGTHFRGFTAGQNFSA